MAETKELGAHIVQIPIEVEQQQQQQDNQNQNQKLMVISLIQQHPLRQISESSGHLLLLKLWQRDEHLFGLRICHRETTLESLKQQIFQLCCTFFLFHALALITLFTSSDPNLRHKWWVPAVSVGGTSGVMVVVVQMKLWVYRKAIGELGREKSEKRALSRCVQELRMRGSFFDLCKEPQVGNMMKSSSVEIKWRILSWSYRNLITISLLCFSGLVFAASNFILCAF